MLIEWYLREHLGLRIVRSEVQQGYLHALDLDLPDRPVSVARNNRDEVLGTWRAVRRLKVGEGQMWRSGGFLQPAAPAQGVPKRVDHTAVVHLDEGSAGEGVEVREPDAKGGEIRQGAAGSARDLLEPLA